MLSSLRSLAFFGCLVLMMSSGCGYVGLDVESDDDVALDELDGAMGGAGDVLKDEKGDGGRQDSGGGTDGDGVGGSEEGADGSGGDEASGGVDGDGGSVSAGGGSAAGGADGSGGDDAAGGASGGDGGADGSGGDEASGGSDGAGGDDGAGGTEGSGGDDGTGGLEGAGGAVSSGEIWDAPLVECSTNCIEPVLVYRPFEDEVAGVVKEDPGTFVGYTEEVVHSGGRSLVTTQGEPGTDAQVTHSLNPGVTGDLYYRAWLYVPTGTVNDWVKILALNGASVEGIDLNLLLGGEIEVYSQMTSDSAKSSADVVPQDQWFCLQMHADVANDGVVEVWVNEEIVITESGWDTQPGGSVDRIVYGIAETGSNQTGATIYTDDVIAATVPVPCGPY